MARLTDTQLVILSTASRRDDRGVVLPTAVDKLIRLLGNTYRDDDLSAVLTTAGAGQRWGWGS